MADHQQQPESAAAQPEWRACEPGALWALAVEARAHRGRQSRTRIVRRAATAGAALLLAVAVTFAFESSAEGRDDISCPACHKQFDAYSAHLRHEAKMDASLADRVRSHLEKCPFCHKKFEKEHPGLLPQGAGQAKRSCVSKSCCCGAVDVLCPRPCVGPTL